MPHADSPSSWESGMMIPLLAEDRFAAFPRISGSERIGEIWGSCEAFGWAGASFSPILISKGSLCVPLVSLIPWSVYSIPVQVTGLCMQPKLVLGPLNPSIFSSLNWRPLVENLSSLRIVPVWFGLWLSAAGCWVSICEVASSRSSIEYDSRKNLIHG